MSDPQSKEPSGPPAGPDRAAGRPGPASAHEAIRRRAGLARDLDAGGRERRRPFSEAPRLAGSGFSAPPKAVLLIVGLLCLIGVGVFVALRYEAAAERIEETQAAARRAALEIVLPSDPERRAAAEETRRVRIQNLHQGALRDSQNGQPLRETEGYRMLLDELDQWPAQEFAARSLGPLPWQIALDDPDRLRGEVLDYRGLLVELTTVKLDLPYFGGSDVWRAVLFKADGSEPVFVDVLEPPPPLELERDVVEVTGVLYRTMSYVARDDESRTLPWLVAKRLRRYEEPTSGLAAWLQRHSLPIMVVLLLAAVAVGLSMSRSAGRSRRSALRTAAGSGPGFRELFERPPGPTGPAAPGEQRKHDARTAEQAGIASPPQDDRSPPSGSAPSGSA